MFLYKYISIFTFLNFKSFFYNFVFKIKSLLRFNNNNLYFKFNFKNFFVVIFFVSIIIYVVLGIYIVKPPEKAVVTRFGKYNRVTYQGPHWLPIIFENKQIVNTEKLERSGHYGSYMLTKDENIITVEIEVQYRINDVEKYLFNLTEPDKSLKEAADSALRQVIGSSDLDFIMTLGKEQVAAEIHEQLQHILDSYNSGIHIAIVALRDVRIPNDVKSAFDDVIKAQEEKEQLKHQAESFANKVIPEAKGDATRILESANAYKQEVIFVAEGDVVKFKLILPQYKLSPDITKTRLYIDMFESILSRTTKILIDLNRNNNIIYLPIDKLLYNEQYEYNIKSENK